MRYTLSFREETFRAIGADLFSDMAVERAGYLFCRPSVTRTETRLVAREFIAVAPGDLLSASSTGLSIASRSYVRAMQRADRNGEALFFIHSHPRGVAEFSGTDDEEEPPFFAAVHRRVHHDLVHGSIVFADPETVAGRVYLSNGTTAPIDRFRVVGRRLHFFDHAERGAVPARFDRQVLAFGKATQRLLSSIHAGVVGYGGTGSSVFEQLMRLGIGKLTVIDDDVVTETNPTRIYGSRTSDAGLKKVEVARRSLDLLGYGTELDAVDGTISHETVCARLRDCDVVFGCTDDQLGRAALTRLALYYYIPVIDVAVSISVDNSHVDGIFGRVTTLVPGGACLFCRRRIQPERIAAESLLLANPEEYRRRRGEDYVVDLDQENPSVIFLTTAVAAGALWEFFRRITGIADAGTTSTETLYLFDRSTLVCTARTPEPDCLCGDPSRQGLGDTSPFLGLGWLA